MAPHEEPRSRWGPAGATGATSPTAARRVHCSLVRRLGRTPYSGMARLGALLTVRTAHCTTAPLHWVACASVPLCHSGHSGPKLVADSACARPTGPLHLLLEEQRQGCYRVGGCTGNGKRRAGGCHGGGATPPVCFRQNKRRRSEVFVSPCAAELCHRALSARAAPLSR